VTRRREGGSADGPAGTGVDARSVGELLLDADSTARAALWHPDAELAKARVRTWGEVVDAAADLWAAIPDRDGDPSMARVHALAQSQHRAHRRTQWPGPGPADPHLESVATTLARAAELVSTRTRPQAPRTEAGIADAEAARTRLMHVVYVSAHSVTVALAPHLRDLRHQLDTRHVIPPGESLKCARDAARRVTAVERLAGSYLHTRWPGALTGEHRDPPQIPRLEHAVARWDLHAHRALTAAPTTANLALISRVEQHLALAAGITGAAAASQGLLDRQHHTDRLAPAVTHLAHAWGRLGAHLQPLVGRQRRLDPELLLAGNELQAALREITHDRTGIATPAQIATRVDLAATTAVLQRGLAASVDLAHVVRDALTDPALTVSARGANAMATAHATPSQAELEASWVGIRDLQHNRAVDVPGPARAVLTRDAEQVIATAVTADSAGAADPPRPPRTSEQPAPLNGRTHQDRATPDHTRPAASSAVGCDR
jgi:hypothetical protein